MILLSSSKEATVQNDTNRKSTRRRYIRLNDKNSALPVTEIGNQYLSPFLRCRDQAGFACGTE